MKNKTGFQRRRSVTTFRPRLESLEARRVLAAATNLASISGTLFDDVNQNGSVDPADPKFASAMVQLVNAANGNTVANATTDAQGAYQFAAVTAGNYFVRQPAQTLSGGRVLTIKTTPTIVVSATDVTGTLSTQIDSFDTTQQVAVDDTLDNQPVFSQVLASEAIGGQRDLIVNNTSTSGQVRLSVDQDLDTIAFDSISGGDGERRIVWDGIDANPAEVDDTGLANVNLTQQGGRGFNLVMGTDVPNSTATIRVYSDDANPATATRYSTATIAIPVTTPLPSGRLQTIPEYLDFATSFTAVGGGADFTNVTAIELEIDATSTTNGIAELIGAFAPTPFIANIDNFDGAELGLTKTVDIARPNVGDTVNYTIQITNNGPLQATGVQVTDPLPDGIRFLMASSGSNYNAATGVWTVGTLPAGTGNVATLVLTGQVESVGTKNNVATITQSDQTDSNSTNNVASVEVTAQQIDLAITKTVDDDTPNLNSNATFTITVSNTGPDDATNVSVLDQIPAGMTFLSSSDPTRYNSNTGIWTVGTVASGDSSILTILASVDQVGSKTNTARVMTADQFDPNSTPGNDVPGENDQQQVIITPVAADLSLTKSVNDLAPDVGDVVRFTLTVANSGPSTATGVLVRDQLPSGTQFVSASFPPQSGTPGSPQFDSTTGIWNVGTVAVGTPVTIFIDTLVTEAGFQTNMAEITASDQPDTDSIPNNNDPGEDDQDDAGFRPQQIDLMLTKTVSNFSPSVGDEIEFVITVRNTGENVATGVQVAEQLPGGLSPLSVTPSRGSYNESTRIWNIGTIGLNDPVTLRLRARVDQIGMGSNSAQIIAADQSDVDSTPNNNIATEDDQASVGFTTETADLSLTKVVDGNDRPNAGDMLSFDLTVSNAGPDNASGVRVTDLLPTGLSYVSNSVSAGIYNPSSGVWTIGELPAPTERQTLVVGPQIHSATSGTMVFTQNSSPARYESPIALFQSDPLGQTANALIALGWVGTQFQLRQVSRDDNPTGLNIEIRFLGEALAGIDIPRINLVGNLDTAVNTETVEDSAVGVNAFATLRINAIVDTTNDRTNIAEITASDQTDPDSTPGNGITSEDDYAAAVVMPQSIDLSLQKISSIDRPNPGDEVTFTLSVNNSGPDDATGVQVTDQFPSGLTFLRSVPDGVFDAQTGLWLVGLIPAGETRSLQIIARADSEIAETNSAEITAADQRDVDSTPGNGVAGEDDTSATTVTPATADLSVTKTVDDNTPNVGGQVVFSIVVDNSGPDVATGIALRDQIPPGMTLISATPSAGQYDPTTGVWRIDQLPVSGRATLTLSASVDSVDDKTNVAEIIASDQYDPDSRPANRLPDEDDQDSASLSPELIDLALSLSIDDDAPNIGDIVRYEIELTNAGPSAATGVTVLDRLPDGLTYQTSRASRGTYDPNTGIWNVGEVAVGTMPSLVIEAMVGSIATAVNTAQVRSADQPDLDSTPGDDDAGADDQASATLTTQVADLSLEKTVDNPNPGRTDEIEFTLRVTNTGPDAATDVIVRDALPPGLRLVSADPTSGSYDPATGNWSIPAIEPAQFQQLRITAAITSAQSSTNFAEVIQSRQIDPDSVPGNNESGEDDFAAVSITPRVVDISVSGTIDNDAPLEGETIQIAFTATNDGSAGGTGIEFLVPLPTGLTLVSSQPQTGTYNNNTGRWIVGDLAAGQATRLVLNLRVDQRGIKHVMIEQSAGNEFDIDSTPGNGVAGEDDTASVRVRAPRLLQKRLFLSR